jgi:hypothetical protein
MDEMTEQLRDIFVDVPGKEAVTERLLAVVNRLRERFAFDAEMDDALVTVVRGLLRGRRRRDHR